ncbi:S41 family peptidase [Bdellovibrio sp. HCB337]|uniref:S41 family peptidase n=1 Tax=Bdellovibrio sp. HCB337 TaxID=3394358 RepID=UPI0039A5AF15
MRIGVMLFLVGALLGCQSKVDQNTVNLGENLAVYNPDDLDKLLEDKKLTEDQRKTSIEALRTAFKASYVGYDLKKTLIGKSGDEIFDECLKDTTTAPMSTVEFYDEVRKCLARIQDTHIAVSKIITSAKIITGIAGGMWVGDQLIISGTRPKLLAKFEELAGVPEGTYTKAFKVGVQVEEIDGRPALEAAQELEPYISGSSRLAVRADVSEYLFTRTFHYPKNAKIDLKLRLEDGSTFQATLPWVIWSGTGSLEPKSELVRRGLSESSKLGANTLPKREGFEDGSELFKTLINRHEYHSSQTTDSGSIVVTGYAELNKQMHCYLQISGFSLSEGTEPPRYPIYEPTGDKFLKAGFIDVIKTHLQTCEAFKANVILDLRSNGGGTSRLAAEMFSLFENTSGPLIYQGRSHSTRPGALPVIFDYLSELDPKKTKVEAEMYLKVFQEAQATQSQTTAWVLERQAKFETGIFNGKVLVLTGPQCVSACDNSVRRFKATGRGTIVGEATNGTGFGFISDGEEGGAYFRDPFNLYLVSIPNSAFQSHVLPTNTVFIEDEVQKGLIVPFDQIPLLENHPTIPDVEIKLTRKDLLGYEDYLQALVPLL